MASDVKTLGIVLRRTNYGEADRILNLITPLGKLSAIAKGVRKARSKLAGGVEMFTLSRLQIHQGRSELGVITSAQMVEHYSEITKDYERMLLAGVILKRVAKLAEHTDSPEWFEITKQCLAEINNGTFVPIVEGWFCLNAMRAGGEELNLYRDADGKNLKAAARYDWDIGEQAFRETPQGEYGEEEIKLLRLATGLELTKFKNIKTDDVVWEKVLNLAQTRFL